MEPAALDSFLVFGYVSLALLLAVFFRTQFKFLQQLFIPSNIIAGLILLLLGPGILGIVNIPAGQLAHNFVFHLITVIFILLGLRGFKLGGAGGSVAGGTVLISKVLGIQALLGVVFTILVVLIINPQLFSGFSSFLMLGFGFDGTLAQYFGGFWQEELAFAGGSGIAYSFAAIGFLVAYVLGLIMIVTAKNRGQVSAYPRKENEAVLSGIVPADTPREEKEVAGRLTTGSQSIESFTLHLSVVGLILLVTYGLMRLVAQWIVLDFGEGAVIVGEVLMNFNFLLGFALALLARRIIKYFRVEYILDTGTLNRALGIAVDYMVVAAIVSIPLIISTVHLWETLALVIIGAVITLFVVMWLCRILLGDGSVERNALIFGFVTGNISSSVALLRVVDPKMESPLLRELTYAAPLSFLVAIPLLFIINLPLIGEGVIYMLYAFGSLLFYLAVLFMVWYFIIRPRIFGGAETGGGEDASSLPKKKGSGM